LCVRGLLRRLLAAACSFGDFDNSHVVKTQADASTCAGPSLAAVHFFPTELTVAKAGHVLEVYSHRGCAFDSYKTDDNTIAKRAGPVRVDLAIDGVGRTWWHEGRGGLAK